MKAPEATTRPWWRRRAVRWAAAYVALRVATVVVFRRQDRRGIDVVRHLNRAVVNPAMLHMAGRRHWYAARLEHVGRRSGRRYATPVIAKPVRGGFAVPLPYGTGVDWLRNVRAARSAEIEVDGRCYTVTEPRVVPTSDIAAQLPPLYRGMSRLYRIRSWLLVAAAPAVTHGAIGPARVGLSRR